MEIALLKENLFRNADAQKKTNERKEAFFDIKQGRDLKNPLRAFLRCKVFQNS